MKKFLAILCAAVMVASLATCAFAFEPEGSASPNDPFNGLSGETTSTSNVGAGTTGTVGGGATTNPTTPSTPAATSGSGTTTTGGTTTGSTSSTAVVANIADYTVDSLAKILVSMLNSPATDNQVYTSADVIKAMKIDGQDEKTVKGTPVDTSKLTVISKALDEKSTGVKFTKNDDGTYDVELNGNELTRDRKASELIIIVAPKDPAEQKAYMADVEINNNILKFQIPMDAAICVTLLK